MSRIRSVHPGFATDDDYCTIPIPVRYCLILLLTEADDFGAFEWKPVRLKMRLFPADNVDINQMLQSLMGIGVLKKYEIDGRAYGLIRNFRKWQSPQKPSRYCPVPDGQEGEFNEFIGLGEKRSRTSIVIDPAAAPANSDTGTGMARQKGGREKEKEEEISDANASSPLGPSIDEPKLAFEHYNHLAAKIGLPIAKKLDAPRRIAMKARIRDAGSLEAFNAIVDLIQTSSLCLGDNDRRWRADLDFVLQRKSFRKLAEGSYTDQKPLNGASHFEPPQQRPELEAHFLEMENGGHDFSE